MADFEPFAEIEHSLLDFAQHHREAQGFTSNAFVSIARAGFLLYEQPSFWSSEHEERILAYRAGDYSDESLDWYEDDAPLMASFACYALGALFGLYSKGKIDDTEFSLGEALLPAALLEHNLAITHVTA